MTDNNTGGKGPISSGVQPGPGEHMAGASGSGGGMGSMPGASGTGSGMGSVAGATGSGSGMGSVAGPSGSGSGMGSMAGASGAGSGMGATEGGSSTGKGFSGAAVKETGSRIAAEARHYAEDLASQAKEKSRVMFDQQKENAVGQVGQVCNAIRGAASQLHGEGQDQVAHYIELVADQLDSLGNRIREKDIDTIIRDTQDLARRAPTTFFVGSMVAGFLLARFIKSSSNRSHSGMQGYLGQSSASPMEARRSGAPGGIGSASSMGGSTSGAGMSADTASTMGLASSRNGGTL